MKIAVTGASGGLGSRIVRIALSEGHQIVGIDKVPPRDEPDAVGEDGTKQFRFVEVDVREYDQVVEALRGNDAVIHLAAIPNPGDYLVESHNLNVVASWNVLRASAELGIERICQASSINAIGLVWGENPLVDYLPMDEKHPCRPEDPYSLSKLISELQADTIIRRWPNMRIASIRLAWAVPNREYAMGRDMDWVRKELWGWVDADESARAFVLGVTAGEFKGHETFFTVAPNTCQEESTMELVKEHWPNAQIRKTVTGCEGLYDCSKAERILGWKHKTASVPEVIPGAVPEALVIAPTLAPEPEVPVVVPSVEPEVPAVAPTSGPVAQASPAPALVEEPAQETLVVTPTPEPVVVIPVPERFIAPSPQPAHVHAPEPVIVAAPEPLAATAS